MSDVLTQRRPAGVTVLAILILLDAAFNIVFGAYLMIMSPSASSFSLITDHMGNAQGFSPFMLFIDGLISFIFGFMLVWLFRITLVGSATAGALINFLADHRHHLRAVPSAVRLGHDHHHGHRADPGQHQQVKGLVLPDRLITPRAALRGHPRPRRGCPRRRQWRGTSTRHRTR